MGELSAFDYTLVGTAAIMFAGAVSRVTRFRGRNPRLLAAHLLTVVGALLGVSVIFYPVDELLGSQAYANLIAHVLAVFAMWMLSSSVAEGMGLCSQGRAPWQIRWPTVVVAVVVTVAGFFVLDPASDRGLEAYQQQPAYVAYWLGTMMMVVVPAPMLLRAMVDWLRAEDTPRRLVADRAGVVMLTIGYICASAAMVLYVLVALFIELVIVREIIAYIGMFSLAVGLMVMPSAPRRPRGRHPRRPGRVRSR